MSSSAVGCDDDNGGPGPAGGGGNVGSGGTAGAGGMDGTGAVGAGGIGSGGTGEIGTGDVDGTGGMPSTCDDGFVWNGTSCVPESNDCTPACGERGTCAGGVCVCEAGYMGAACDAHATDFYFDDESGACLASMCVPDACDAADACDPATGLCCDGMCGSSARLSQWGGTLSLHARGVAAGDAQAVYVAGDSNGAFEGADHAGSNDHFLLETDAGSPAPVRARSPAGRSMPPGTSSGRRPGAVPPTTRPTVSLRFRTEVPR